jgi:hypothetical protein
MNRYLLTIIAASAMHLPAIALESDSAAAGREPATQPEPKAEAKTEASPFKFSVIFDAQVQKNMWDEFGGNDNTITTFRATSNQNATGYQDVVNDFWMRVTLKGSYRLQYLEGVFNLRFYPYWTMRRTVYVPSGSGTAAPDLLGDLDVIELNQAYVKVFKEYSPQKDLTFQPYFKVGRDGLLNSCSELFGNYLDLPTGGYAQQNASNIIGPFLNRKVFANQMEVGFAFNVFNMVGGATSLMIGGDVNNDKFYSAPFPRIYELLDSKFSAGFYRVYQDLYFFNKRIHIGGGVRDYSTPYDSASAILAKSHYFDAQGAFDAVIYKDLKFYTEMAMQKIGSASSPGIGRPINVGITIPTFGAVDTLAVEFENVATTFFSDSSMRDATGQRSPKTMSGAWGIVVQKKFLNRLNIAWGIYTGDPYGDMQAALRISTYF